MECLTGVTRVGDLDLILADDLETSSVYYLVDHLVMLSVEKRGFEMVDLKVDLKAKQTVVYLDVLMVAY